MPLPFREPFFLRGRTSVMQRAVILFLMLGGLAYVAGRVTGIAIWILLLGAAGPGYVAHTSSEVRAIATTAMIYGPLNFWNARPWHWCVSALFVGYALPLVVLSIFEGLGSSRIETLVFRRLVGVAAVSGFLQIRCRNSSTSRLHQQCAVLSSQRNGCSGRVNRRNHGLRFYLG